MTWVPKEKEIAAVLAADGRRRYEYFIHRVCDTRKVWGLYDEGWASLGDSTEKLLPFWPHAVFAQRFALGEWKAYTPRAIELDAFLATWIPGLEIEGVQPAIFPNQEGRAVILSLADLEADLRRELADSHGEDG